MGTGPAPDRPAVGAGDRPHQPIYLKNSCEAVELFTMSELVVQVDVLPGQPPGEDPADPAGPVPVTDGAAEAVAGGGAEAVDPSTDPLDPGDPANVVLEIEDGETTLFEAAINAFHADEFQRAESLFLEEAERTVGTAPQRAAIAFRQAALAARRGGNVDGSDHWMRLAGREYLRVSEDDRTPLPFIREAAVMAAKCFLSVENLHVATKGLRRAQAIESVLRADDDLMSGVPGIPFRHGGAGPTVDADAETAPATPVTPLTTTIPNPGGPISGPENADEATSDDETATSSPRAGRIQRIRQYRARRNVA